LVADGPCVVCDVEDVFGQRLEAQISRARDLCGELFVCAHPVIHRTPRWHAILPAQHTQRDAVRQAVDDALLDLGCSLRLALGHDLHAPL